MALLNSKVQVIGAVLLMVSVASAGKKEIPVVSGRSVRLQVESLAELMEKEIVLAKTTKEKFQLLGRAEDQIISLRENNSPQNAHDEAYMDLLMAVFGVIPEQKEFKKKDCAKYEADLLNEFEPAAEDAPTEPAVKPGWAALQALCK
ncbi:hypothetical protein [Bdellovibrio svalbardensis]|uniref:Uncharacterized protein n=1 Tax=Bdellovibrio svalbardensis TaxID=2972972 RepID=A0ABT6DH99_9BACT|nr:hypothetical protein [Bdellovibrio svalbardensis]MDG0815874.1 hypothetical protein [Bdellovibrio svalbardensis]